MHTHIYIAIEHYLEESQNCYLRCNYEGPATHKEPWPAMLINQVLAPAVGMASETTNSNDMSPCLN